MKIIKFLIVLSIIIIFIRWFALIIFLWGVIEIILFSIKNKKVKYFYKFICNIIFTVLTCIDILLNIVLAIPANRYLITKDSSFRFGNPSKSFTKILKTNYLFQTLTNNGIKIYNVINFYKNIF